MYWRHYNTTGYFIMCNICHRAREKAVMNLAHFSLDIWYIYTHIY